MDTQNTNSQIESHGSNEPTIVHVLPHPVALTKKEKRHLSQLRWNKTDKAKQCQARYRIKNKEKINKYQKSERCKMLKRERMKTPKYKAWLKEWIKSYHRKFKYYPKSYNKIKSYIRKYQKTDKYKQYLKAYSQRPYVRLKKIAKDAKRRALKRMVFHNKINVKNIINKTNNSCLYCEKDLSSASSVEKHIDHYYPVALIKKAKDLIQQILFSEIIGNENNLWLACGHCNDSKGKKLPLNYIWDNTNKSEV